MKLVIEKKDVGQEIDLSELIEYFRLNKSEDSLTKSTNKYIGETLSGAKVSVEKTKKKPGPKKGTKKKAKTIEKSLAQPDAFNESWATSEQSS